MDVTVHKWQMRLSALALVALAVIFAALCVTETYAANEMNLTPQSKGEYAALYYQFVQDYVKNNPVAPGSPQEKQFKDADMVDFNKDGQYELILYYANTDESNALISVWSLEAVTNYYSPIEGYDRKADPFHKLGFGAFVNFDAYITEYNGRPVLVRNQPDFGYRQLRWVSDDGTVMETVIRENMNPNAGNEDFYLIEGLINTYRDADYSGGNVAPLDKHRTPEAARLYTETGKAVSTWGIKAGDMWRAPGVVVDFAPKVTNGERLLNYVNE